jgi:charged multivesicular body protein 1
VGDVTQTRAAARHGLRLNTLCCRCRLVVAVLRATNVLLPQIASTMQLFEKQFENLDLQTQVVEGVMSEQAAMSTPEDEVTALMQQVADEHGLEVQIGLPGAATAVAAPAAASAEPDLNARLAELKGAR